MVMAPSLEKRLELACRLNDEFPLHAIGDRAGSAANPAWDSAIPPRVIQTAEQDRFGRNHHTTLLDLRERNPELSFEFWDRQRRDRYMQERWGRHPIGDLYQRAQFGVMQADLFRYCVIHDRGGFYLDINKILIVPLRSLLHQGCDGLISFESTWCPLPPPPAAASRLQHPDRLVVQWGFGFRAGHPLLARMINAICSHADVYAGQCFQQPSEAIRSFTGPGLFTQSVLQHLEAAPDPGLVQAGIDFQDSLRYPHGAKIMQLTTPHYKHCRDRVILSSPAEAAHQRGLSAQQAGDLERASLAYQEALRLEAGRVRSLNNLAALVMQQGDLQQAASLLAEADQQHSQDPEEQALLLNTGCQLQLRLHRPDIATQLGRQRARLTPDAISWTNLALALSDQNQPAAAERCQRLALGLQIHEDPRQLLWTSAGRPAASTQRHRLLQNLAVQQLRRDPWKLEHWQLLEARLGVLPEAWNSGSGSKGPAAVQHLWRGETVDSLLVWDEQGYGDAMQCLRWLPLLLPRCQRLTLLLRPSLIDLVKHWLSQHNADHTVDLQPLEDPDPQPWQRNRPHCPLMSLPVALGLDGSGALCGEPNPASGRAQPSALPRRGRIGLVWAAGHSTDADARSRSELRSLPADMLVSVLNQQLGNHWQAGTIQLVNLQQDRPVPQHPLLQQHLPEAAPSTSWLDTHQQLSQLDGLLCVDTAIAHLAGLVGLPTVLVLNTPCDWRWGMTESSSRWYPNLVLSRQRWQPISGSASPPPVA